MLQGSAFAFGVVRPRRRLELRASRLGHKLVIGATVFCHLFLPDQRFVDELFQLGNRIMEQPSLQSGLNQLRSVRPIGLRLLLY